jgi:hypothetical protein
MKTLRQLWIEMSVREISTQCQFALIAWANLDVKAVASNDVAFSSAHSFLSHAANVSKLLRAEAIDDANDKDEIGRQLGIPTASVIHDRKLRNHLEHYDERLRKWIILKGVSANIGTYNLGPKGAISGPFVFVTHYDPNTRIFTFVDEDFELNTIAAEVRTIQSAADGWVAKHCR